MSFCPTETWSVFRIQPTKINVGPSVSSTLLGTVFDTYLFALSTRDQSTKGSVMHILAYLGFCGLYILLKLTILRPRFQCPDGKKNADVMLYSFTYVVIQPDFLLYRSNTFSSILRLYKDQMWPKLEFKILKMVLSRFRSVLCTMKDFLELFKSYRCLHF